MTDELTPLTLAEVEAQQPVLLDNLKTFPKDERLNELINHLIALRTQQRYLIKLHERHQVDLTRLGELEQELLEPFNQLSQAAIDLLHQETAFNGYHEELTHYLTTITTLSNYQEIAPLQKRLNEAIQKLELLLEVLDDLSIEDTRLLTQVFFKIAEIYEKVNRANVQLAQRRQELWLVSAAAEFATHFELFSQRVTGALALADTPEKVERQLSHLLVQLDDLENNWCEFEPTLVQIAKKRQEILAHFQLHKQSLLQTRQRRILNLNRVVGPLFAGIRCRVAALATLEEQNVFFATDTMILKLNELTEKFGELGDDIKAENIQARLTMIRHQAVQKLRDQQNFLLDRGTVMILGQHHFRINNQLIELILMPYDHHGEAKMTLHLSGTHFFQIIDNAELNAARNYWNQRLVSESESVYRSEYLAASLFNEINQSELTINELLEIVRRYAAEHEDEGYVYGVHDIEATLILEKLRIIQKEAGLLRFSPTCRAIAQLFWVFFYDQTLPKAVWEKSAKSLYQLQTTFGSSGSSLQEQLASEITNSIQNFITEQHLVEVLAYSPISATQTMRPAADYLIEELKNDTLKFSVSANAMQLAENFTQNLAAQGKQRYFEDHLKSLKHSLNNQVALTWAWLSGYASQLESDFSHFYLEAVAILLIGKRIKYQVNANDLTVEITQLLGQHPRVQKGTLTLQLDEFLARIQHFMTIQVPAFRAYRQLCQKIIAEENQRLDLEALKPQVPTYFVCNRLISEVYFHFIGDNFAKQMGTVGEDRILDFRGLLILISPPNYGKTTLMTYLAQNLGLLLVKISCFNLGEAVTSLDPAAAPNATARQELEKLHLALEIGHNVMLYLEDIEYSHPMFLQQFIFLADAARQIKVTRSGVAKTYHFGDKRFCFVMGGSFCTPAGEKITIPEMLATRADIYYLSEIIKHHEELFALSYLENALTSNPVLAPLATRDSSEIDQLIRLAEDHGGYDNELSHHFSDAQWHDMTVVLKKLLKLREVVLKVNQHYIASAMIADRHRTEPAFNLLGSYSNMNQMAEQVTVEMSDEELESLIDNHYFAEAQRLTTDVEENWLKLAEIRGTMTEAQAIRWADIKPVFNHSQNLAAEQVISINRLVNQLEEFGEVLKNIQGVVEQTLERQPDNVVVEEIKQLIKVISDIHFDINVVNQQPSGLEMGLKQLIEIVDNALLPIVQDFERKSRLDILIFERVKEMSETLKGYQKDTETKEKVFKRYKPLSFRED